MPPWEKYQAQPAASAGARPWEKYKAPEVATTKADSLLRGAAQGASLGFIDELTAGVGAGIDKAQAALGQRGEISLEDAYRTRRDVIRKADAKASEDNPGTYTVGELGGSVVSALAPGAGVLQASKGATAGAQLGKAAAMGATQGAGLSTADLTKGKVGDFAQDVAVGGALGAGTQGALMGAGKLARTFTPENVAKKMANVVLDTPEEITDIYIKNPQGVKNAPKRFELAQTVDDTLGKLREDVTQGSAKSRAILDTEGKTMSAREIADLYNAKADELLKRSEGIWDDPQQEAAYKWLKSTAEKYAPQAEKNALVDASGAPLAAADKQLSTNRVKDILQGIDRQVDFETGPGKFSPIDERVKKHLRSQIDERLKGQSPAYADQMKGVAADTALLSEASDIAKKPAAMANVLRRIETDQYGGGQVPRETLEALDKRMGTNILEQAKLSNAREAFDKSLTQGSKRVNFFNRMTEGVPVLNKLGPVIGSSVDKYGRKMTMGAVDAAVKLNQLYQSQGAEVFRREVAPLLQAVKAGDPAAVLTFQMLSKANPQAVKESE